MRAPALRALVMGFCLVAAPVAVTVTTAGCATVEVKSFNDRALVAVMSVEAVVRSSTTLLNAGKISSVDAENVQKQADTVIETVRIARSIYATDPTAGEDKLTTAISILTVLEAYLAGRQ